MTPQQARTARGCALIAVALLLVGVAALRLELTAAAAGGHSTISELVWIVWARQPWVLFITSHLVAAAVWFLAGHFTAQASSFYDQVRAGGLSLAAPMPGGALSLLDAGQADPQPAQPSPLVAWLKSAAAVLAREALHFGGLLARAEFESWLAHERLAHFPAAPVPAGTTGPDIVREEPPK